MLRQMAATLRGSETMNKTHQPKHHLKFKAWIVCAAGFLFAAKAAVTQPPNTHKEEATQWIGTWATAAQPFLPESLQTYRNQTLRLIVHTSAGGARVRIRISNTYGDKPL